ncbi:MAG: hypothetical protein ABSC06_19740 [Rhodopila sp.]
MLLAFPQAGRLPSTISAADLLSALFESFISRRLRGPSGCLEGGHIDGGGLASHGGCGWPRGLVGLPVLAGDVGIGGERPFGSGQQGDCEAISAANSLSRSALLSKPVGPSRSSLSSLLVSSIAADFLLP